MTDILRDALSSHMPNRSRSGQVSGGIKYTFDCPACVRRGYTPDRRQRGAIFFNHDGSEGYDCFNCRLRTRQQPGALLTSNFKEVLGHLGMSSEAVNKLSFAMWSARRAREQGIKPPAQIVRVPAPSGAKPLGEWIANPEPDPDLLAVLDDLDDMSPTIRDSYLWTPEPGPTGDMHRRYIWMIGPPNNPLGWLAKSIDEPHAEWLASDPTIWLYEDEDD